MAKREYTYAVAAGVAITTRKGIRADGDAIDPSVFGDDKNTWDSWIKKGVIVKQLAPDVVEEAGE